ncbi:hypothetical protein, partial [Hallella sp.]|uniref:hypothetical protein n=1 Tax=Hallella sp. TaxID=2980186 RepID=UPI00307E114B
MDAKFDNLNGRHKSAYFGWLRTNDPTAKTPGIKKNAYVLFNKLRSEMGEKDRSTRAPRPTTNKKPEDSLESSGFALLKEGGF